MLQIGIHYFDKREKGEMNNVILSVIGFVGAGDMLVCFVFFSYFFYQRIEKRLKKNQHYDKKFLDILFLTICVSFIPYSIFLFLKDLSILTVNVDKL